jgi:hypothetical protein
MVAFALYEARQLYCQYAIIKGIVGLGKVPFLFSLRHPLYYDLGALLGAELVFQMME